MQFSYPVGKPGVDNMNAIKNKVNTKSTKVTVKLRKNFVWATFPILTNSPKLACAG